MKTNLIFFLHDEGNGCKECVEVEEIFSRIKKRSKDFLMEKINDSSFQEVFRGERLPILRVEGRPVQHYSGTKEILNYILTTPLSKYLQAYAN